MSAASTVRFTFTLLVFVALALSCVPSPLVSGGDVPKSWAPSPALGASSDNVQPLVSVAERPPPPIVTTPKEGDPSGAALADSRLIASTCEEDHARNEARVVEMRAQVDAQLERWRSQQPQCRADAKRNAEGLNRSWSVRSGSVELGGLGLSGIGEGGGGRGEGMGLGSIGTIGHGSAVKQATSASKTNNQVQGVDEADIVKTDGKYVYIASNGALRIIEAMSPHMVSVTKLDGDVRELFIEGDRAVVYASIGAHGQRCTYGYDCAFAGDGSSTRITVLDVANHAEPKAVRHIELSGSLMASRRIGKTVHTVVADGDSGPLYDTWPPGLDTCGVDWRVASARFAALKIENAVKLRKSVTFPTMDDNGSSSKLCKGLYRTSVDDGHAFTTLVSFALDDDHTPASTATLQSRPGAVFASSDALYLSVTRAKRLSQGRFYVYKTPVDEVSEIHKFKIGASPSDTRYIGSGVVPGHVLNQFAMDEWSGYLRVATTRGRVPSPNVESSVSILRETADHSLVRVGAVENIAPHEDIRAVRFDGDRAYVVTFKKTDPLFVIDLYHPASPAILGELKIPGFSTYLHRLDATHLLSIGFDANDHGDYAYFDGVILQLFDVTNPTAPKLLFKEKIGSRGSSSAAATDHLAFNYQSDRHLLAIPMTVCEGGGDGTFGDLLTFSGLYVYDVSLQSGFKRLGGVDHGTQGASCSTWWSRAKSTVERSVFLDDLVYSVAGDRVKVQRMSHFGEDVADMRLTP